MASSITEAMREALDNCAAILQDNHLTETAKQGIKAYSDWLLDKLNGK